MEFIDILIRIVIFTMGMYIVIWTVGSIIQTFIMPRSVNTLLTSFTFRTVYNSVFRPFVERAHTYEQKDRILAFFAPCTLFILPLIWLTLVWIGYTLMYRAVSMQLNWREALVMSGSSLMTLGFKFTDELPVIVLAFSEAALGMMLIAVLIGYLPTMYNAFSARESWVTKLEIRAGSPPSSVEMIRRLHFTTLLYNPDELFEFWKDWEDWFALIEESHTTLAPLNFFRSAKPDRSWVTAAGTVMDAASIVASTLDIERSRQAAMTIRSGFTALRSIADFFGVIYNKDPQQGDPISLTREQFYETYDKLVEYGIPVLPDREQCWVDFAGWRVNYDVVLRRLAFITYAPYATWISDHMQEVHDLTLVNEVDQYA